MALSKVLLKQKIEAEMTAQGFVITGEHVSGSKLAEAIANTVVDEIQQNADVEVTGGSSTGTYKAS